MQLYLIILILFSNNNKKYWVFNQYFFVNVLEMYKFKNIK